MVGTTLSQGLPRLSKARLKRLIAIGNALAFAIGLWTLLFASHFYLLSLVLCFALPLAAIALDVLAQGTLGFEERRGRRYPLSLATILVIPSIALAGRALLDLNFASYTVLLGETAIAMAAIFVIFLQRVPGLKGDRNQLATIGIFAFVYGFGVLAFADVALDPSPGRETQTIVRAKRIHVSGGVKGSSIWYQLKVAPDASPAGNDWIRIRPDLWPSFARGDTVCVHVGPGLLAATWYTVRSCPASGAINQH